MSKLGGSENIPTTFIKLCGSLFSIKLCVLFNLCIDAGSYPEYMKTAMVIPLREKGVRHSWRNYHRISLLCNLSTIFASLITSRVKTFFL